MTRLLATAAALATALTLLAAGPGHAAGGQLVVKAQRRLDQLGCQAGAADGRADRQVRSAVVRFQSAQGMRQTGRLDAPTRRLLFAESPRSATPCDRRAVPARSVAGRRIVVSQRQNWVWLVGPRGHVAAQGGMVDNPDVLHPGSYAVGTYCGRSARIRHNRDYSGGLWLDDFVRFAPCGIGFHRIPRYRSTGRQIHPDWWLGTDFASSHGCLRLSHELAEKVWHFTARRTPVRVVN